MPEINHVAFRYEPIDGCLFVDELRRRFYMERLDDCHDALQYLAFAFDEVRPIEGELHFSDADDEPPCMYGLRYSDYADREDGERPFPDSSVELWPA